MSYKIKKVAGWLAITCKHNIICSVDVPGAPQKLKMINATMFTLTLTWSPPSNTHGLAISMYIINCSASPQIQMHMNNIVRYTDTLSASFSNLQPFTSYNCCVAAISSNGNGKQACKTGKLCNISKK